MSMPGFWEVAFLALLALLIFGPDKLPGMARSVGRTVAHFRREAQSAMDELKRAAELEELRQVGRELKETASEIEREAALASAALGDVPSSARRELAGGERPAAGERAGPEEGPPPFDPDAT